MRCPHCDKTLDRETLHGETVDRCPSCEGIWLDQSELRAVVERARPADAPKADAPSPNPCCDGLACPRCGGWLAAFNYAYDSGVMIQRCGSCHGVWLEPGQLGLLARYQAGTPETRRLAEAFADDIQRSKRWQRARQVLRSRWLSGLVAGAYLLVAMIYAPSPEFMFRLISFLLFPLVCIWFCDAMGNLTGIALGLGRPMITRPTPGDIVAIGGWLVLLLPVILYVVHALI